MGNPVAVTLDPNLLAAIQKVAAPPAPAQAATAPAKPAAGPAVQPVEDKVTISAGAQAQAPAPAQVQAQPAAPTHVPTLTQIRNLSRQGESLVQIANKLGLSQQVVASYLGVTLGQQ